MGAKGLSPSIEWDCQLSMQKGGFFKVFMCSKGGWTVGVRFPTLWVIMILISCFIYCVHSAERVKTNSFKLGHPIQQTMHPSTCIRPPKKELARIKSKNQQLITLHKHFLPWLAKSFFHCYYQCRFKKKKIKKNFTEHDKFSFKIRGNVSLCTFVKTGDEYVERKYQWLSYHNSRPGSILIAYFDGTDLMYKKTDNKLSGVMNS